MNRVEYNLANLVRRTPLVSLEASEMTRIYGKAENLQERASYKIRGLVNVLRNLPEEILAEGVSTVSAGNLGQTLAYCASLLGIHCEVFVPDSAPRVKKEAIQRFGAELVELPFPRIWELVLAGAPAGKRGFIHPCFNTNLLQGYETIASEILDDLPGVDAVVIPYGLGGLTLGVASALKTRRPSVQVYTAEIEGMAPVQLALKRERHSPLPRIPSIVDAIGTPSVIPAIFEKVRPLLSGSIVVSEAETISALRSLYERHELVVEGAAAVAYAAARKLPPSPMRWNVACILSGGNIEPGKFTEILESHSN